MRKILLGLSILSCIAIISCKKGDVGAKGDKGDTGAQGLEGIKGSDGSTILSGNGAPAATIGNVGDYYIDLSTANFYGAKTAQGWGNPISLKGSTGQKGADGTNGTKILAGSGAPSNSIGNIGDFYLDTTNVVFYGPKISSTDWGNQLSLRNDSTSIKTYVISAGFNNIELQSKSRDYQTSYWYDYDIPSQFVFNQDDAERRSKYKYYNYGIISYNGQFGQIAARAMNVDIWQYELAVDSRIRPAVVGQSFQFLADSSNNSFLFTKEDSIRMATGSTTPPPYGNFPSNNEYYSNYFRQPIDPTLNVGDKIRYGEVKSKVDSLNTYGYSYNDSESISLSQYITNFNSVLQNGLIYISIQGDPAFHTRDTSQLFDDRLTYDGNSESSLSGNLNDSTSFNSQINFQRDNIKILSQLYAGGNGGSVVNTCPSCVPSYLANIPLTGSLLVNDSSGNRPANYNAEDFKNKQFVKIRIVVIPPSTVINLSAKGVNVHDKNAVKRALKL